MPAQVGLGHENLDTAVIEMRRLRALQAENKRKAAAARLDEALWLDRDTLDTLEDTPDTGFSAAPRPAKAANTDFQILSFC